MRSTSGDGGARSEEEEEDDGEVGVDQQDFVVWSARLRSECTKGAAMKDGLPSGQPRHTVLDEGWWGICGCPTDTATWGHRKASSLNRPREHGRNQV